MILRSSNVRQSPYPTPIDTVNEVLSPINASNLREAHRRVETGAAKGKIVVESF